MRHEFGAHTIDAGGIEQAARRAGAAGMTALQVFTAKPTYYNERIGVRPERAERFRAALHAAGIGPERVLAHAAYVINAATSDAEKWERSAAALAKELERAAALGILGVCFHPGWSREGSRREAIARVARAMTRALEAVAGTTMLLVENTAGAGGALGSTAEEVGEILAGIPRRWAARTGYGLDTCHLFAAGHDIAASPGRLRETLDGFEAAAGRPPAFFHLNDSEGGLGSRTDRHLLIGSGRIGEEPFRWLLADRRTRGVPLILETPQENPDIGPDDPSPDPADRRMIALLRRLVRPRARAPRRPA